jgi:hypothetical protein
LFPISLVEVEPVGLRRRLVNLRRRLSHQESAVDWISVNGAWRRRRLRRFPSAAEFLYWAFESSGARRARELLQEARYHYFLRQVNQPLRRTLRCDPARSTDLSHIVWGAGGPPDNINDEVEALIDKTAAPNIGAHGANAFSLAPPAQLVSRGPVVGANRIHLEARARAQAARPVEDLWPRPQPETHPEE